MKFKNSPKKLNHSTTQLGYYMAIQNWNGGKSIGIHDENIQGPCPPNTHGFWNTCCCHDGCCWSKCVDENPPDECLSKIPHYRWARNDAKGYFEAVRKTVDCGNHIIAYSCEECPQYDAVHPAIWCNGQCIWRNNKCWAKTGIMPCCSHDIFQNIFSYQFRVLISQ